MSPVVISRGVLRVRFNCQQSRSLVRVQSQGSGKEALLLFFVAVICKWVWLPATAVSPLPSIAISGAGQEAQTLDRGGRWLGQEIVHSRRLSHWLSVFQCESVQFAPGTRRAAHLPSFRHFHLPNVSFFVSFVLVLACLTTQLVISLLIQLAGVL